MAAAAPAELWRTSAATAVELLRTKQVTPLQLVEAAELRWKVGWRWTAAGSCCFADAVRQVQQPAGKKMLSCCPADNCLLSVCWFRYWSAAVLLDPMAALLHCRRLTR